MSFHSPRRLLATILSLLGLLLATVTVTVVVSLGDEDGPAPPASITITIGGKANPQAPVVVVDRNAQHEPDEAAAAADPTPAESGPGIHEDLRDEQPAGAPADALERVLDVETAGRGPPLPQGGAQNYACPARFVRNHSARAAGAKVSLFVLHYTVSRPGSLGVIRRLFDTPSFGASSTLGLEPSGRCEQWVPFDRKPWTQGAFNSVAESVEIIAMGTEPRSWWLAQPILKNGILAAIVADRLRARGLPPRRVDPAGCGVQQAGWTDHAALECGNTHHDVSPNFPYDVFGRQLVRAYGGQSPVPRPRLRCSARNLERVLARRLPRFRIVVDGELGGRSRAALRYFQRAKGLDADGIAGPKTGTALGLRGCTGDLR